MYRFFVTASILVLLGLVYLGNRLIAPIWPSTVRYLLWGLLVLMVTNLLWLPFRRWRLTGKSRRSLKPANHVTRILESCAYNYMGFLSLLLAFTALSELVRVIFAALPQVWQGDLLMLIPAGQNFDSLLALGVLASAALFFTYGRLHTMLGPRLRSVRIVLPVEGRAKRRPRFRKHHSIQKKLRLAQVSDLHIGRAIKKKYVAKVTAMVNAQQADLVCFTGDIGDGIADTLLADASPLRGLIAHHSVYYIPGNHEYYWGLQSWLVVFEKLGFKILLNRGEKIQTEMGTVFIAGVSDPTAARFGEELPKIPKREESHIAILLAHHPNFARSADAKHYDLMLAGHTHGGQYIPWTWIARLIFRFASGLYRSRDLLVYVNEGTGYWGAPLRIGTRPEITVIDIYYKS